MTQGQADPPEEQRVPRLRGDLKLMPAGHDEYGAPCWTIHDPVRNRYFQIGYGAFEMLRRWHLGLSHLILEHVRRDTVLTPDEGGLKKLIKFLHGNGLLERSDAETVAEFSRIAAAGKPPFWKWVIHNYLFVRIPLLHPDRFLRKTQWIADAISSRAVQFVILLLGIVGMFLTLRQWDLFTATFMGFANWQGLVWMAVTLTVTKILHELGHAYSATRYGCRVPSMGVALLVLYPVLYTDTSDAWRLTSREQRLRIGAAGIRVELMIALVATFMWHLVPQGPFQSALFLLATTTWISTLLINLSPFMRFDGYYLLSDYLGIANLQNRSFAMAKWTIRETLFDFGHPPPEPMPRRKRRLLSIFAVSVWIYRFFLFLGIALVVYHLFFKALGIVLFVIEIAWFIVIPIINELKNWWKERAAAHLTPYSAGFAAALFGLLVLSFIPWQSTVSVKAVLRAQHQAEVIASVPGQVTEILVKQGDRVTAGDALLVLSAPELVAEHRIRELELAEAEILLAQAESNPEDRGDYAARLEETRRLSARISALEARQDLLTLKAQIDGELREFNEDIRVGDWLAPRASIGRVVNIEGAQPVEVVAYVPQQDIARLGTSPSAVFYPEQLGMDFLDVSLHSVEPFNAETMDIAELVAAHGGDIAARQNRDGLYEPLEPVFKVSGTVNSGSLATHKQDGFRMTLRGELEIEARSISWANRLYEAIIAGAIREFSF